jgi:hypothetical protein
MIKMYTPYKYKRGAYFVCIYCDRTLKKYRIVKSEWMFIARQQLGKHIAATMNTHTAIE